MKRVVCFGMSTDLLDRRGGELGGGHSLAIYLFVTHCSDDRHHLLSRARPARVLVFHNNNTMCVIHLYLFGSIAAGMNVCVELLFLTAVYSSKHTASTRSGAIEFVKDATRPAVYQPVPRVLREAGVVSMYNVLWQNGYTELTQTCMQVAE